MSPTKKQKGQQEATRSLDLKWRGLYQRAVTNELSEFELSMFKAIERELVARSYPFRRRKPLFVGQEVSA